MNGGSRATFFTFPAPAAAAYSVTKWDRLFAALMASCLLHLTLVLAPTLGAGGTNPGSAPPGLQNARPPSALDVRLEEAGQPEARLPITARAATNEARTGASRGVELLRFPAQSFRTADQLTKHPRPKVKPVFDVRPSAFTPGKVILKVWIDANGVVLAVEVEESSVPEALSASAAAAFRRTPFVPGEVGEWRVPALMRIEVTYADGIRIRENPAR